MSKGLEKIEYPQDPTPPGQEITLDRAEFELVMNGYLVQQWQDGSWTIDGSRVKKEFSNFTSIMAALQNAPMRNRERGL